LHYVVSF